jgi:arylsulfatase A-like enzyme
MNIALLQPQGHSGVMANKARLRFVEPRNDRRHLQRMELDLIRSWDPQRDRQRPAAHDQGDGRLVAGLLRDLKSRYLLDEKLVVWVSSSAARRCATPPAGATTPRRYTMWLAGGGTRVDTAYGQTDEFGSKAVENKVHVHDLHATILHLLGLDHLKLTYATQAAASA